MSDLQQAYQALLKNARETAALASVEELLNWDQRTYMPRKASTYRAEQITLLSGLIHDKVTDPLRGEWLNSLRGDSTIKNGSDQFAIIQKLYDQYEKTRKVPRRLVEEISRTRVLAHEAWVNAREESDFSLFQGHLATMVQLYTEKTDAIGFTNDRYDVLLDDYEPLAKTEEIRDVFRELRNELIPLIETVQDSKKKPDHQITSRQFDIQHQRELGMAAAKAIGFDFGAGRLDVTHHPFCCTLGPEDIRITTRYRENLFNSAFFGTLHEAGHGLYEQGLRKDQFGLPTGEYCSLGIHESQSRLWENMVGRSLAFWKHFFPRIQKLFPQAIDNVTVEQFYGAVNVVEPSLIRVEADEATYSLHVIIRFELEQELFAGNLSVSDLPGAWCEKYQEYLGITPDTDAQGVLQDVHWSEGLFGYFPTYALGNLYASQFFDAAQQAMGNLDEMFARGEFASLLNWLRENVHIVGNSLSATEILHKATGQSLSHGSMIRYLRDKYSQIYEI